MAIVFLSCESLAAKVAEVSQLVKDNFTKVAEVSQQRESSARKVAKVSRECKSPATKVAGGSRWCESLAAKVAEVSHWLKIVSLFEHFRDGGLFYLHHDILTLQFLMKPPYLLNIRHQRLV